MPFTQTRNFQQMQINTYLSTNFSLDYSRVHYLVNYLCIFFCGSVLKQQ